MLATIVPVVERRSQPWLYVVADRLGADVARVGVDFVVVGVYIDAGEHLGS